MLCWTILGVLSSPFPSRARREHYNFRARRQSARFIKGLLFPYAPGVMTDFSLLRLSGQGSSSKPQGPAGMERSSYAEVARRGGGSLTPVPSFSPKEAADASFTSPRFGSNNNQVGEKDYKRSGTTPPEGE